MTENTTTAIVEVALGNEVSAQFSDEYLRYLDTFGVDPNALYATDEGTKSIIQWKGENTPLETGNAVNSIHN